MTTNTNTFYHNSLLLLSTIRAPCKWESETSCLNRYADTWSYLARLYPFILVCLFRVHKKCSIPHPFVRGESLFVNNFKQQQRRELLKMEDTSIIQRPNLLESLTLKLKRNHQITDWFSSHIHLCKHPVWYHLTFQHFNSPGIGNGEAAFNCIVAYDFVSGIKGASRDLSEQCARMRLEMGEGLL